MRVTHAPARAQRTKPGVQGQDRQPGWAAGHYQEGREILFDIIKIGLPLSIMGTVFAQGLMLAPGQLVAFSQEHPLPQVERVK
jgi:hypothetical protein